MTRRREPLNTWSGKALFLNKSRIALLLELNAAFARMRLCAGPMQRE
jgi:hypothetical protein